VGQILNDETQTEALIEGYGGGHVLRRQGHLVQVHPYAPQEVINHLPAGHLSRGWAG
jgi:hypothetical protein